MGTGKTTPRVVLSGAARTPVGLKCGTLRNFSAEDLAVLAADEAIARSTIDCGKIDGVVGMGRQAGAEGVRLGVLENILGEGKANPALVAAHEKTLDKIADRMVVAVKQTEHPGSIRQHEFDERLAILIARYLPAQSLEKHIGLNGKASAGATRAAGMRQAMYEIDKLRLQGKAATKETAQLINEFRDKFGTDLIIVERGGESRALTVRQMAYHHLAQGRPKGEPYLVSF